MVFLVVAWSLLFGWCWLLDCALDVCSLLWFLVGFDIRLVCWFCSRVLFLRFCFSVYCYDWIFVVWMVVVLWACC